MNKLPFLAICLFGLNAMAVDILPVTAALNTIKGNSVSKTFTIDNTQVKDKDKIEPFVVKVSVLKWLQEDVEGIQTITKTKKDDEISSKVYVNPPVRKINEPIKYTNRVIYKGKKPETQESYRIFFEVSPEGSNGNVVFPIIHNVPLLVNPEGEIKDTLEFKTIKRNDGVYTQITNTGNIAYRARSFKVDGKEVKDDKGTLIATPYIFPNKKWTIKGSNVELGSNILK